MKDIDAMSDRVEPIAWAGAVILHDRKLLTLKEVDKSFHLVPGGKLEVEKNESDEEAARREVLEELGARVTNLVFLTDIEERSKKTGELFRFRLFMGELIEPLEYENLPARTERVDFIDSRYASQGIEAGGLLLHLGPFLLDRKLID